MYFWYKPCGLKEISYSNGSPEALFYIQVAGGFIEHVYISSLNAYHGAGKSLELSTAKIFNITISHRFQVYCTQVLYAQWTSQKPNSLNNIIKLLLQMKLNNLVLTYVLNW